MGDVSKNAPLVSVAMITYNHGRFIDKAIESVLAQRTNFRIELVIGDDASSDDTSRRIEALSVQAPSVVRTLHRSANIGMHRNLEGVLKECRGEFVAFLEGDDYWICEDKLQAQVDALRVRDDAVGVFHSVTIVDPLGRETGTILPESCVREVGTQELLERDVIPTVSVMIRRDAIPELPDSFRKLRMRDWPMWIFASLHGPWLYLPKVMAAYRLHDGGVWSSLSTLEALRANSELLREVAVELSQPFSAIAREKLAGVHLSAWQVALACDLPADARRERREVVRLLSYYRPKHSKRLVSALWQTLSPRTHRVAKRALRLVRLASGTSWSNPVHRM